VVEEGGATGGQRHTAQAQTVLEEVESPSGGRGGNAAAAYDASFSTNSSSQQIGNTTATTTSSQLTMPGFRRTDRCEV
jgi:hypothetical protein